MAKDCKQQWWKDAKFGMFIHWGLYALPAGEYKGVKTASVGEWIMKHLSIPVEEYSQFAKVFNPVKFNAEEWAKLAYDAGMKYMVITAKHHDGFAMFKSAADPYNIVDATPFGRDPMKELSEACRKYGIKFCFYYSQVQDWYDKNGCGYGRPDSEKDFNEYLERKCLPQLTELLTHYGDIGLIWFDTPQRCTPENSKRIYDHVKSLQPNCIVSGRIGNNLGEYMSTGDNVLPLLPYPGDWEVPATLNDTWGFKKDDTNWKSPKQLIELLVKINSRGGNYLLNVGPTAEGVIPEESAEILRTIGRFMQKNGESIYGTHAVPVYPYDLDWVRFTAKPGKLYMHLLRNVRKVYLPLIRNTFKKAYYLESGEPFNYTLTEQVATGTHRLQADLPDVMPNELDTVICFELNEDEVAFETLDTL